MGLAIPVVEAKQTNEQNGSSSRTNGKPATKTVKNTVKKSKEVEINLVETHKNEVSYNTDKKMENHNFKFDIDKYNNKLNWKKCSNLSKLK